MSDKTSIHVHPAIVGEPIRPLDLYLKHWYSTLDLAMKNLSLENLGVDNELEPSRG